MKFKYLIFSLFALLSLAARGQEQAQTYFQYPIVPDSITSFNGRCDYLAEHFFDFCDLTKAFSNRAKMRQELNVYLTIIANADIKVADANVRNLMKKLEKQPKDQLMVAEVAEQRLYGDSAEFWIDQLYLPFAESVSANKRVDKAEKARFAHQAGQLRNSLVGKPMAEVEFTRPDGTKGRLAPDSTEVTVVFFNDPDCSDCNMARLRLSADISTGELIREGKLKVVAISLSEPDDAWREFATSMPAEWTVGAAPDADLVYDLRLGTPDFYVLGRNNRIRFKHIDINQLLDISRQLKKR